MAASAAPADAMPKISGPKRTISVGKFDAIGAFTAKYGNWDIGGGLSAMMTTALIESGQFIVVERANLQQVLSEQELKASRLTIIKAMTKSVMAQRVGVMASSAQFDS